MARPFAEHHASHQTPNGNQGLLPSPFFLHGHQLKIWHKKGNLKVQHFCSGCNSSNLSFAATANKKVFEDQLRGIVCYRDEKGELVCEGYDEGPTLGMRLPEEACFPWPVEVQVTDFIQLATLRVFEDADVLQEVPKRQL